MKHLPRNWAAQTVPHDIWRAIFEQAVDTTYLPTSTAALRTSLKLSHVCTAFRLITTSSSELWHKIPFIIVPNINDGRSSSSAFCDEELVRVALKWASSRPLVLNLMVDTCWDVGIRLRQRSSGCVALTLLMEHIHMVKVLSIDHTAITISGQYLKLIKGDHSTPLLEELHYHGAPVLEEIIYRGLPSEYFGPTPEIISKLVEWSKQLKTLKLYREQGFFVCWKPYKLSLNQLSHLEIDGPITLESLIVILSTTNALQECKVVEIWDFKPAIAFSRLEIRLPFLRKLDIKGSRLHSHDDCLCYVLSLIIAPSLEILALSECDWDWHHMLFFMTKSDCKLQNLSLEGVLISPDQLLYFLELVPYLECLTLDMFFFEHQNLTFAKGMEAWNTELEEFTLCPQLQYLGLFYTPDNCKSLSSETPLSDMIKMRFHGFEGAPVYLTKVHIMQFNLLSVLQQSGSFSKDMEKLLALNKEGFNISFGHEFV